MSHSFSAEATKATSENLRTDARVRHNRTAVSARWVAHVQRFAEVRT